MVKVLDLYNTPYGIGLYYFMRNKNTGEIREVKLIDKGFRYWINTTDMLSLKVEDLSVDDVDQTICVEIKFNKTVWHTIKKYEEFLNKA